MRQEISSKSQVAVACLGLFLASLFLTAYSSRNPSVARIGNTIVLELIAPISGAAEVVTQGLTSTLNRYVFLATTAKDNESLRSRVIELEQEVARVSEFERENVRLRALLQVASDNKVAGVSAAVIGGDPSGWVKGVVVNKGSSSGIRVGMAVLHPQGVVGQVVAVSSDAARVLLVSDHSSGVDVLLQDGRARGVVEGAGEQGCELKFVTKDVQVREGDVVITSGMDSVYPKGIVLGRVSKIADAQGALFQTIEVMPAVDFSKIEEVLLVTTLQRGNNQTFNSTMSRGVQ
jgi:rod shape-determining protein MreC